jgi:hypothetical protein
MNLRVGTEKERTPSWTHGLAETSNIPITALGRRLSFSEYGK